MHSDPCHCNIFYLNLAECALRICPFKARTWPSLWSHQTRYCMFCHNKRGKPIEIPNTTTQGTRTDCLVMCWLIYVLRFFFSQLFDHGFWEFDCEMQDAIEKLLIWSVTEGRFGMMGFLDHRGRTFRGFDWWSCANSDLDYEFYFCVSWANTWLYLLVVCGKETLTLCYIVINVFCLVVGCNLKCLMNFLFYFAPIWLFSWIIMVLIGWTWSELLQAPPCEMLNPTLCTLQVFVSCLGTLQSLPIGLPFSLCVSF